MSEADVVIAWSFAPVPASVKSTFTRPTRFIALPTPPNRGYRKQAASLGWPYPIKTILAKYAPGVTPLRVALLGFSESCHGVRNLLGSGDGARVDSVIAIDGIHTPYRAGKKVDPLTMRSWFEFAKMAVINTRLFVDTHSSVVPPNFASTTETANYIWNKITNNSAPFTKPALPPLGAPPYTVSIKGSKATGKTRKVHYPSPPWSTLRRADGLVILGCKNLDPPGTADHIYQARVILPLVLAQFLALRWNSVDPRHPDQSCFIGDLGASPCAKTQNFDEAKDGWLPGMQPDAPHEPPEEPIDPPPAITTPKVTPPPPVKKKSYWAWLFAGVVGAYLIGKQK